MLFCLGGTQVDSPKNSTMECLTLSRQEGNLSAGPGAGSSPGPWALMAAAQWTVSYHPLSTLEATVGTDSRIPLQRADHSFSREVCCALHTRCVSRATSAEGYARHGHLCTAPETLDIPDWSNCPFPLAARASWSLSITLLASVLNPP